VAAEDTHISMFQMFFLSGDVIGLIIIWFLLGLSALSVGFTIKMAIGYRRPLLLPEQTRGELNALISEKKYRDAIEFAAADPSYLGKVTNAALIEAGNGYTAMERAVEESSEAETSRLLRPLEYLNVVGNIAPMLGLFGTVYGMIVAFQQLVESQGQADPQKLAAGISTALVTTFWGLVVAIPALAAYALIRNKVDALTSEGILMVENIINPFKPSAKKSTEKRPRAVPKPE
jgi:biopolymer transport protein ExbB